MTLGIQLFVAVLLVLAAGFVVEQAVEVWRDWRRNRNRRTR